MSLEAPRINQIQDLSLNEGEPNSGLPLDYVDAYRAALSRLGVSEADVEKCALYVSDSSIRSRRTELDMTKEVESFDSVSAQRQMDSLAETGRRFANAMEPRHQSSREERRVIKSKSKTLVLNKQGRIVNKQVTRLLNDPAGATRRTIESLVELTDSPIKVIGIAVDQSRIVF